MAEIIFRRLFEIRILHGFYLDHWFLNASGNPALFHEFIDEPQSSRLAKQASVLEYKYDLRKIIAIEPTKETEQWLSRNKIILRHTPLGIFAGIQVRREGVGDAARFFPVGGLEQGNCRFVLTMRDPQWLNAANHALMPTIPGYYYFTNLRATEDRKNYPSLSAQPPEFESGRTWEMGDLIRDGNQIRAAQRTTESAADFEVVGDALAGTWHSYAHAGERVALPKIFKYRFDSSISAISSAEFILSDLNNNEIKRIAIASPQSSIVSLDFRYLQISPSTTENERIRPRPIPDGAYVLDARINGVSFEQRRIVLSDDLRGSEKNIWGIVDISTADTTPAFRLFNADGSLNAGLITPAPALRWRGPVFEIRLMGRLTYWRYIIENQLSPLPADPDFTYNWPDRQFSTVRARRLSQIRLPLSINLPAGPRSLPSPPSVSIRYDETQKQYFSEIFLLTF